MSAADASREELIGALAPVREAIDIPNAATAADEKIRARILLERVMHAVLMLRGILDGGLADVPRSTAYPRVQLARHPATGYRTWDELMAERARARKGGGAR